MEVIKIKNLKKTINGKTIFENLNLSIESGCAYKLLGGNGCGKTTLIKCILGITDYSCGEIEKYSLNDGEVIKNKKIFEYFSVYLQEVSLPKTLKVSECLELFRITNGFKGNMEDIIKFFDIEKILKKRFGALSTGEKNIVLLLTTLINNSEILILDEPFIGLDDWMKHKLGKFLINYKNKYKTIIVVSHEDDTKFLGNTFYDYYIDGNKCFEISKSCKEVL